MIRADNATGMQEVVVNAGAKAVHIHITLGQWMHWFVPHSR
jgi:hypothetical protein